jgi:hypothetical protein
MKRSQKEKSWEVEKQRLSVFTGAELEQADAEHWKPT